MLPSVGLSSPLSHSESLAASPTTKRPTAATAGSPRNTSSGAFQSPVSSPRTASAPRLAPLGSSPSSPKPIVPQTTASPKLVRSTSIAPLPKGSSRGSLSFSTPEPVDGNRSASPRSARLPSIEKPRSQPSSLTPRPAANRALPLAPMADLPTPVRLHFVRVPKHATLPIGARLELSAAGNAGNGRGTTGGHMTSTVRLAKIPAGMPAPPGHTSVEWATVTANTGIWSAFGTAQFCFSVDSLGDTKGTRPTVLGFVPHGFTDYDQKLYKGGGWGIGSNGEVHGAVAGVELGAKVENAALQFQAGDKVYLRIETAKNTVTVVVESKKKKSSESASFRVPLLQDTMLGAGGAFLTPAVSLSTGGAQVTLDGVQDLTPVEVFGQRIQAGTPTILAAASSTEDDARVADALGPFYLRLLRRMGGAGDVVKVKGGDTLSRGDVKVRAVLVGYTDPPCTAGGDALEPARVHSGVYNAALADVMADPTLQARLREACGGSAVMVPHPPGSGSPGRPKNSNAKATGDVPPGASPTGLALGYLLVQLESQKEEMARQLQGAMAELNARIDDLSGRVTANAVTTQATKAAMQQSGADAATFNTGFSAAFSVDDHGSGAQQPAAATAAAAGAKPERRASVNLMPSPNPRARSQSRAPSSVGVGGLSPAQPQQRRKSNSPAPRQRRVLQKESPKRPMAKPKTQPAQAALAASGNPLITIARKVRGLTEELRTLGEKGSPSDDDLAAMERLKRQLGKERHQAAKDMTSGRASYKPEVVAEAIGEVADLVQEVVERGDDQDGSLELFDAVREVCGPLFGAIVKDRELATVAAYDGSVRFLGRILSLPQLDIDVVELVQCALFNQHQRIQVTALLLEYADKLSLGSYYEEIQEVWQEFFADVASSDRALPRENRAGRLELLRAMLLHAVLKVDPQLEGNDSQTVWSRAAREGDTELLALLLKESPVKVDVNRVQSDKTTALIQAVIKNQVKAVKLLVSLPQIDVSHVSTEGSALHLAKALQRHPDIQSALA